MQQASTAIGSYRGKRVAQGGFGEVYCVQDAAGRQAALKWAGAGADETVIASLEREYEILSQLVFPQLPRARDFGYCQSRPYIVTEWIDGPTLWESLADPTPEDFTRVLRQLASVLSFVHHHGWVHGDLKPDNLRWRERTGSACLCLLDFGLARPVGDPGRPRGAGTVGYCAPEFLRNEPADGRADWYAVGAILYEWIFGVRPYADEEVSAEIAGHLESAPDLTRRPVRAVPSWAVEVVARLLAKNADDRGRDVTAILAWLAGFEPDCDPCALLNGQLDWHRQSEDRRWDDHDRALVAQVVSMVDSGEIAHWSIVAHGECSARLPRQIAFALTRSGRDVLVQDQSGEDTRPGMSAAADDAARAIRIDATSREARKAGSFVLDWSADLESANADIALVMLPWDTARVSEYVRCITGDAGFAAAPADRIHRHTGGIPRAVSTLLAALCADQKLLLTPAGGALAEDELDRWSEGKNARAIYASLIGKLTLHEHDLCDWLALGRGEGCSLVLEELGRTSRVALDEALQALLARGVVVRAPGKPASPSFDLRLRLAGHDAVLRVQMPPARRRRNAALLAEAIRSHQVEPSDLRHEVLMGCWADAGQWDAAIASALEVVSGQIARDAHADARRTIARAQIMARRIDDSTSQSHWLGRARMAEGDLQKATGAIEDARRTYRELLIMGRRAGDRRLLAETLKDLGDLYRITRQFGKGVRALRQARRLWSALDDKPELSRTLMNLGNMYWVAADRVQARKYYNEALAMHRTLEMHKEAAVMLSNLGALDLVEYQYADAEAAFRDALAIHRRLNVPVEAARTLNNLGAVRFLCGDLDEAEALFGEAAALNTQADAQSEAVFNRRNLVEVAVERGDLRTAVTLGGHVYEAARALGDIATAVEVDALLTVAYLRAGDFRAARQHAEQTAAAAVTLKNDELQLQLALAEAERYLMLFRHDEAATVLAAVAHLMAASSNRHLRLHDTILRMRIAVGRDDPQSMDHLWEVGQSEAREIGAPHLAAHLATVRLAHRQAPDDADAACQQVEALLHLHPRWHWAGAYHLWQAQHLASQGQAAEAVRLMNRNVAQLRKDGNWETLWRALVVLGRLHHDQADYEPALRALNEAGHILDAVARTITVPTEQDAYRASPLARMLDDTRTRIQDLVA